MGEREAACSHLTGVLLVTQIGFTERKLRSISPGEG